MSGRGRQRDRDLTYQLVIQYAAATLADFDRLIDFEETVWDNLGSGVKVDGHDFGGGEFNLFIFTDEPIGTFHQVRELGKEYLPGKLMRASYRKLECDNYTAIWPPELTVH